MLHNINTLSLDYLIARFASADRSINHLLESYGFVTLDCVVTLSMKSTGVPPIVSNNAQFNIREACDSDLRSLKKLAYSSYTFDRFHTDPIISHELADKLHAVWTENCLKGDTADMVLVAEQDGVILGYIACKVNKGAREFLNVGIGNIVLIATSKEYQRKGIAQALIHKSLGWMKSKNIDLLEVATQIQNVPALWLYQKMGFKIVSSNITMRKAFGD
jgi:dTDP-4-amino-4,6-dideoxy-D-galactose acyltransferase